MPEETTGGEQAICPFYARTATCRFSYNCTRAHPKPTLSQIILIPNFFSHFALEQALLDEYDTDLNLEYEDSELYKAFLEFYDDVMPELKSIGEVIQFKVCCNLEPHLRGNVYVQYKDIKQAVEAYRLFNGRFYNGRQLSLQFVKIPSWRSAICGLFTRKRCPQKRSCYFLHVFWNPTKEFVSADNDWKELVRANSKFYPGTPIRRIATPTVALPPSPSRSPIHSGQIETLTKTNEETKTEKGSHSSNIRSSRTSRDRSESQSRHDSSSSRRQHSDDDSGHKYDHRDNRKRRFSSDERSSRRKNVSDEKNRKEIFVDEIKKPPKTKKAKKDKKGKHKHKKKKKKEKKKEHKKDKKKGSESKFGN